MAWAWGRAALQRPAVIGLVASTACGLALGVLGPFGSYLSGSLGVRIGYWLVCVWAGSLTFAIGVPALARWAQTRGLATWVWAPPAVALLTLPPAALSRLLALKLWPVVGRVSVAEWFGQCLAISAIAMAVILWVTRRRVTPAPATDLTSADPRDRLSPRLGRTVLCLQVEDHYVRVHTSQG
ncbi:MAG: hypothetical protein ACK5T8_06120, partial [Alphaproteobacteria bacterium]